MEFITAVYLVLMFVALYFFSFFVIITIKNRKELFAFPIPKKAYFVSVIIPVYNEEESVQETIEHVMNLDYPKNKLEVIAINDGSKDRTKEIIRRLEKKYSNLKLLDKKNSGKADSINQGIKIAKGELVAVVDADSFPSPGSLKKLIGYFDRKEMGAVTSFVSVRNTESFFAKIQSLEYIFMGWNRKLLDFVDSVYVTNGPLSLYRKKYVVEVGGFDPKTVTEDIDITWNLLHHGYKTAMCLDARVSTIAPVKIKPWFRQRIRWGVGGLIAISKFKKAFLRKGMFGSFVLPFVSLSIIAGVVTFLFSSYIILREILTRGLIAGYSVSSNVSLLHWQNINLHPPVLLFYLLVLFTFSLIYYNYVLYEVKYEEELNIKRLFTLVFYLLVYLTIYPVVWFVVFYRFVKKDYRW